MSTSSTETNVPGKEMKPIYDLSNLIVVFEVNQMTEKTSLTPSLQKNNAMKSVAFIHLDLGIGGAENLIVNAAKGLARRNHDVTVFTSFHDPTRSFKETTDGTLKVFCSCLELYSVLGSRIR